MTSQDANYFDNVIKQYKDDLERRQKFETYSDAVLIRKLVRSGDAVELVEKVYGEAMALKKKLGEQETLLARMKLVNESNKRMAVIVKKKFDIEADSLFKRQNSYD